MKNDLKPGTFKIYKGKGAAQFSIIFPRGNDRGFVTKDGAVLLEAASSTGTNDSGLPEYDWSKKVTFALGVQDIINLVDPRTNNKLIHKNGDLTKVFELKAGEGKYEGTYQLLLNDGVNRVFVPVSGGEYMVLTRLLVGAINTLIAWP